MRRVFAIMTTVAFLLASCKKEDSNVVQSIQFTNVENGRLTLLVGENFRVKYTVEPASLQETAVLEWTSSKEDVASVRNGRISANEEGKATITAKCGNATATISVEVETVDVTDFKLPSSVSGYIDAPVKVDVTGIEPEGGSISSIVWSMADESIATCHIDAGDLYVTGVKQGTTKLIGEGLDVKRECSVTVKEYIPVQSITVTLGKSSISQTASTTVSLNVLPSNASVKDVRWTVSPSSYAEFDEAAMKITAGNTSGTVTITATSLNDNVSGSAELTITDPIPESVAVKAVSGATGLFLSPDGSVGSYPKTSQLKAEVTPASFSNKNITWKSHDTSRATVDENGLVTATGHGSVMIEADCGGVKGYLVIRSVKRSAVQWRAYDSSLYHADVTEVTSITCPFGGQTFYICDPAGVYTNEEGKRDYAGLYLYTNGDYVMPKITLPANVTLLSDTDVSTYACCITFKPTAPMSASPITVDMGIGNPVTVKLTSGINSFSLLKNDSIRSAHDVANGGTITLERPTYSEETCRIYGNRNQNYTSGFDFSRPLWCTNSGTATLVKGQYLTITPSTPKGTYVISPDPSEYNPSYASFTLIIK